MAALQRVCQSRINSTTQLEISTVSSSEACLDDYYKKNIHKTEQLHRGYLFSYGIALTVFSSETCIVNMMVVVTCLTKELRNNGFFLLYAVRSIADFLYAANKATAILIFFCKTYLSTHDIYSCYIYDVIDNSCYLWSVLLLLSVSVARYLVVAKPFLASNIDNWKVIVKVGHIETIITPVFVFKI